MWEGRYILDHITWGGHGLRNLIYVVLLIYYTYTIPEGLGIEISLHCWGSRRNSVLCEIHVKSELPPCDPRFALTNISLSI